MTLRDKDKQDRLMECLVELYKKEPVATAILCDEALDRSGALLGNLRTAVRKSRETTSEINRFTSKYNHDSTCSISSDFPKYSQGCSCKKEEPMNIGYCKECKHSGNGCVMEAALISSDPESAALHSNNKFGCTLFQPKPKYKCDICKDTKLKIVDKEGYKSYISEPCPDCSTQPNNYCRKCDNTKRLRSPHDIAAGHEGIPCPDCSAPKHKCDTCKDTGKVDYYYQSGGMTRNGRDCPDCTPPKMKRVQGWSPIYLYKTGMKVEYRIGDEVLLEKDWRRCHPGGHPVVGWEPVEVEVLDEEK